MPKDYVQLSRHPMRAVSTQAQVRPPGLEVQPRQPRTPSGHQTASQAAKILTSRRIGFRVPTPRQKRTILIALVSRGFAVYGRAFDIVKCPSSVDLNSKDDVTRNLRKIILYEIKSTNKQSVTADFVGYFFSLSTAELLAAQNLGKRFKFVFVNIRTREVMELSLRGIFRRSKAIYPEWSIAF